MDEEERGNSTIDPITRPNLRDVNSDGANNDISQRQSELQKELRDKESGANSEETPKGPAADNINEQEEKGGSETNEWQNKTTPQEHKLPNGKEANVFKVLKKKGPIGLITGGVFGIGMLLATIFSPGLLILQIKEVMVGKFNTQLASMNIRTSKKVGLKINNTTKGFCSNVASVFCRYTSMSAKEVSRFEKAGITVKPKTTIGTRVIPESFKFNGVEITKENFNSIRKSSPEFRTALKNGYNPKFAGYSDSIWQRGARRLGVGKSKIAIDGDTDEAKLKDIQEKTKKGFDEDSMSGGNVKHSDPDADGKSYLTDDDGNPIRGEDGNPVPYEDGNLKALDDLGDIADDAGKAADNAEKMAKKVAGSGWSVASGIIKVTGWLDNACTVYNTVRAVGFAAKTVRALQLAKYAMVFLNIADQIKAGADPDPEDVEYLGKVLTTELVGAGKVVVRAASDAFGYKYAAYGDRGKMPSIAMQFLAGGGLAGDIIYITSYINSVLGSNPKKTCHTLANPWVSAASLVGGVALMIFAPEVAGPKMSLQTVASGLVGVGLIAANIFLPSLLQDIVAGKLIGKDTVGERAMEAITSGSSGTMATISKFGGNAPLHPVEAAAYMKLSDEVAAEYAEEDRLAYSPLDTSNSNTFLGKIYMQLVPYMAKMTSLSGVLSSATTITTGALSMAVNSQTAMADSAEDYKNWCAEDEDYKSAELNLATDPYCNVIYGIPATHVAKDPIDVMTELGTEIDPETGEAASDNYKAFIIKCIEREDPLGYMGSSGGGTDGSECLFGAQFSDSGKNTSVSNSNYYLHYIDQRVENGMSGEDDALEAATNYGYISFYDEADSVTDNVASIDIVQTVSDKIYSQAEDTISQNQSVLKPVNTPEKCVLNYKNSLFIDSVNILCGYAV